MPRWLKPRGHDNWGHETVYLMPPESTSNNFTGAPSITERGTYRVRWPDGTEVEAQVEMARYHTQIADHGHSYGVKGERPMLLVEHHGALFPVRLAQAGVLVEVPD